MFNLAHALVSLWLLAAAPEVPADSHVGGAESTLSGAVEEAERAGLPAAMVANKIREGLAKRVPPARIAAVARQMMSHLAEARGAAARAGRKSPSEAFFRAFVDARWAGASGAAAGSLVAAKVSEEASVQALRAVADLSARGYQIASTVALVKQLLGQDAQGLPRVAREIDGLRRQYALTQNEALERVDSALKSSNGNLDAAVSQGHNAGAGKGGGQGMIGGGVDKGGGNPGRGIELHPGVGKGDGKGMGHERPKK